MILIITPDPRLNVYLFINLSSLNFYFNLVLDVMTILDGVDIEFAKRCKSVHLVLAYLWKLWNFCELGALPPQEDPNPRKLSDAC